MMRESKQQAIHTAKVMQMLALGLLAIAAVGCENGNNDYGRNGALLGRSAEQFEQAADTPPTPTTIYAMSRLLAGQGHEAQAQALLERVLTENPEFLPAYVDLAESQLRQRRYDDAAATLQAGLTIAPEDAVLLNNLGMTLLLKGRTEDALAKFSQAAAAAPRNARYRTNMATALALLGRYDEARSLYEQVLTKEDALHNLAVLSQARGDEDAAKWFSAVAEEVSRQSAVNSAASQAKG